MSDELEAVKFAENPEPRCPCVLLLDTSTSMAGEKINQLNAGLAEFERSLKEDSLATLRVEVCVINFGPVNVSQDFITAGEFTATTFTPNDATPMGEAIILALDKLEQRKATYKSNGITYYRPWIFLITDGAPTDDWAPAAQRIKDAEAQKKVAFFSVGVEGADMGILSKLSNRTPISLKGMCFREMFVWLSTSLSSVSRSVPGDTVPLQSPADWGSV
jgi:uncharacterized protein YegL